MARLIRIVGHATAISRRRGLGGRPGRLSKLMACGCFPQAATTAITPSGESAPPSTSLSPDELITTTEQPMLKGAPQSDDSCRIRVNDP